MARKPRIEYKGALYHIISRGNNRQEIFKEEADYERYEELLKKYKNLYLFNLYAYTLMKNHNHLLLETSDTPLSKIMQSLQQSYAKYFNKEYKRIGHLFQGRYKAILCDKESYLLELIRYIHLNSVRAKIVRDPDDYKFSSHAYYIGKRDIPFVNKEFVLMQFSKYKERAEELYKEFILEGVGLGHQEKFYDLTAQRILGDEEFKGVVLKKEGIDNEDFIKMKSIKLDELLKVTSSLTSVSEVSILSKGREREVVFARDSFIITSVRYCGYSPKEVAAFLSVDQSAITKSIRRMEKQIKTNNLIKKEMEEIYNEVRKVRQA
ncbi:MAG: hypothetical protein COS84_08920 [Armatimonadetes bacterium CG07_land_8_20_14_0_80_40_9]|nr:MAG: hypothetical protein COS84_08920 [Armatimonadetes bacterium CG07_land_8_20_14_0_80_40_9]